MASLIPSAFSDIFAKVKAFIRDMLEKLETDAEADATKKAYCDKELAEANQKKDVICADMEKGPNGIKMASKVATTTMPRQTRRATLRAAPALASSVSSGCASLTSLRVSPRWTLPFQLRP